MKVRSDEGEVDSRRASLLLVTICGAAILASIVWVLQQDDSGIVGTNGIRPLAFVGTLSSKREVCQTLGTTTRTPSAALVTLGLDGVASQPLRVRVVGRTPTLVIRRYTDGVVALPLSLRGPLSATEMLCIRNDGRESVQLGGESFASATLDGRAQPFAIAVTLTGSQRKWGAQAGAILGRIGSARAGGGGTASGWIVVGFFGVAVLAALGAACRFAR